MPVHFRISTVSESNKPEKIDLELKSQAYMVKCLDGCTIAVTKPFIDKLSLVYDINCDTAKRGIRELLWGLASDDPTDECAQYYKNASLKKSRYKTNVSLVHPDSGKSILIQADPKQAKDAFLRFEFNPHKLGRKGVAFFKERLMDFCLFDPTYADLATKGRVTRVDIACDLINCDIRRLIFSFGGSGKTITYFGEAGNLETVYLGKKSTGNASTILYDKKQQLKDKKRMPAYKRAFHTRIERVIAVKKKSISDLPSLKNPFSKLVVMMPEIQTPPESEHHWRLFEDSCHWRGVDEALALIPECLRKKYEETLRASKEEMWRPDRIWKYWPQTLDRSGLLDFEC